MRGRSRVAYGRASKGDWVTSTLGRTFDPGKLERLGPLLRTEFEHAAPFRHVVVDGLFDEDALDAVVAEFPRPDEIEWDATRTSETGRKYGLRSDLKMGPATRLLTSDLNSGTFLDFMEKVTRIRGLVPDPHFFGGGLHQVERGGYLKVHADFSRHPRLRLERRVNLILYLNRDWCDEYGGHLELWDREMTHAVQRVAPVFNRCVMFATTRTSYHGHPEPLDVPDDVTRKSVALYYYSMGRREEGGTGPEHGTLWQRRPGEAPFKAGPGDPEPSRPVPAARAGMVRQAAGTIKRRLARPSR
jgi:hypothetical protein